MDEDFKKLFFVIPDNIIGNYSVVVQISGFETEDEANDYLIKYHKIQNNDILKESTTIH
jgi:hypothetical protein